MSTPTPRQRLAEPLSALWPRNGRTEIFDVVVVGSGYGGAVAAEALAGCSVANGPDGEQRAATVCVLERGQEYLPGEFPSRFADLPGHVRIGQQNSGKVHAAEGLFDIRLGDDVVAMVGNGLGGGSLINAGVLLQPRLDDFKAGSRLREVLDELVRGGHYDQALHALGGAVERESKVVANTIDRHPSTVTHGRPRKTQALATLAPQGFAVVPISVSMDGQPNSAGVTLQTCTLCGDCMTGCNVGAKDSLDTNLLEQAWRRGARIHTGATVLSLRRPKPEELTQGEKPCWTLRVVHTDPKRQAREDGVLQVRARHVVLAAGSFGSTEILLRSRGSTQSFSPQLGARFSCNGDNLAAVHRMPQPTGPGAGEDDPPDGRGIGPTITARSPLGEGTRQAMVQEFAVPAPLKRVFDEVVTSARMLHEMAQGDRLPHGKEPQDALDPLAVDPGAMGRSLLVGIIGHDDAQGVLHLASPPRPDEGVPTSGALRIEWPQARRGELLQRAHDQLQKRVETLAPASDGKPATLLPNPVWQLLPKTMRDLVSQPYGPTMTVHPLGGCGLGDKVEEGVVDEFGRVFDAAPKTADRWFGTLAVLDGAAMPASLGVNPALTIAAFARRAVARLKHEWQFEDRAPKAAPKPVARRRAAPAPAAAPLQTHIAIAERLRGAANLHLGRALPQRCIVELTLAFDPIAVADLTGRLQRELALADRSGRLRVFDADDWDAHSLRVLPDSQRDAFVLFEAGLKGRLRLLHRETSGRWQRVLRAAWAWWRNRGLRDIWQRLSGTEPTGSPRQWPDYARDLLRLAERAGEVRRFDYELQLGHATPGPRAEPYMRAAIATMTGGLLRGEKRLTYDRRANPWMQLTRMTLTQLPGLPRGYRAQLCLDPRFLVDQELPLLRIVQQRDHATALADLGALGLVLGRVILGIHLWSFRKPDAASTRPPQRLSGAITGLSEPQVVELVVDKHPRDGSPVKLRLTRYPRPVDEPEDGPRPAPLVMIHGYSVSGNTFTHPSLSPSAAEFFWRAGRDVWVVDLRTSSGLPTARYPWAMEQAALIDIPAALLHVRAATGRQVDVFAHCIGCAMLGMAVLTDAADVRTDKVQLGVDTWLSDEHLGALAAFNGPVQRADAHPVIRRIVLSQKGPVLRYTDDNVFRAYVMQSVRRWLFDDDFQFRAPEPSTVSSELLDRLLSSLPYPDPDYDVDNPSWPCASAAWTTTRHRMDALYGRDFSAANMRREVLEAIDDLFGPIHLDTVAQTIHFARFSAVTSQHGRGEYVTAGRLRRCWRSIPTFALHGGDNGLADVDTQRLLRLHLGGAGVPLAQKVYAGMGHQDTIIGRESGRVFADIREFLDAPQTPPTQAQSSLSVLGVPWIGPRIDLPEDDTGAPQLAAMSPPDLGEAQMLLIPVRRRSEGRHGHEVCDDGSPVARSQIGSNGEWLRAWPDLQQPADLAGWMALLRYEASEARPGEKPNWPAPKEGQARGQGGTSNDTLLAEARIWLKGATWEEFKTCFVRLDDLRRVARRGPDSGNPGLRLMVGSCQYPAGLLDKKVADASLAAMCKSLDDVDLAVFTGDQIYADATAGLLDPSRRDELFDQPQERALRAPSMRELLRRVPVQMLPDDHEMEDGWEPWDGRLRPWQPKAFAEHEARMRHGMLAWFRYQRMREPPVYYTTRPHPRGPQMAPPQRPVVDWELTVRGHPLYFADTRTGRTQRNGRLGFDQAHILDEAQRLKLGDWLIAHRDAPKFVVTPSLLLPRWRLVAESPANGSRSDAWDGYPATLEWLFMLLVEKDIKRTVFLSGDEHHSLFATIDLRRRGARAAPLRVVSIHSSALYAPFPFANGRPQDLVPDESLGIGQVDADVHTTFAPPGDGYARIELDPVTGPQRLTLSFGKACGPAGPPFVIALDGS